MGGMQTGSAGPGEALRREAPSRQWYNGGHKSVSNRLQEALQGVLLGGRGQMLHMQTITPGARPGQAESPLRTHPLSSPLGSALPCQPVQDLPCIFGRENMKTEQNGK